MSDNLLNVYGKFMNLKIYVPAETNDDLELKQKYQNAASNHNNKVLNPDNKYLDAGFDLFVPNDFEQQPFRDLSQIKIDFRIVCAASMVTDSGKNYNTGYYMDPRSSISKTSLRLANSRGIIDSGYRGPLIGMFDVIKQPQSNLLNDNHVYPFLTSRFDRVTQLCAPGLEPIVVTIVDFLEELGERTERGTGGFGSTGF
jgi:dUTP pyrophosphatase